MTDYLLLLRGGHGPRQEGADVSPAEMQAYIAPYQAWLDELSRAGTLLHAKRLEGAGAKVLRADGDDVAVLDGPYTESKDVVGGYYMVSAASEDDAVGIARRCPHLANGGSVELRQVAD